MLCFEGRSRSPSLAACFHGDRPFLPAAFSRQLATGATCWRAAKGRWGMGLAAPLATGWRGSRRSRCVQGEPTPREHPWELGGGIGDQLGSMCMQSHPPSGASLEIQCDQGLRRDLGTSLALCVRGAIPPREHPWGPPEIRDQPGSVCVHGAIPPREHPWGPWGIGDQPGSVHVWRCPPSGASLGTMRNEGPAWLSVCLEPSPLGSIPAFRGGSGTSLPSPHLLPPLPAAAWAAWRRLSRGTPAASRAWGPHGKALSPPMPVVTFVKVTAGRAVEACGRAALPCPGTLAPRSPGPTLVFPCIISPVPGSPASSPEPDFSSYEES